MKKRKLLTSKFNFMLLNLNFRVLILTYFINFQHFPFTHSMHSIFFTYFFITKPFSQIDLETMHADSFTAIIP